MIITKSRSLPLKGRERDIIEENRENQRNRNILSSRSHPMKGGKGYSFYYFLNSISKLYILFLYTSIFHSLKKSKKTKQQTPKTRKSIKQGIKKQEAAD